MPVTRHMVRQPSIRVGLPDISDMNSDIVCDWDASVSGSITSSGGFVSQWNDLSFFANHFTQTTSGSQPQTGVATIGGLNAISFSNAQSMQSGYAMNDVTSTMYAVVNAPGGWTGGGIILYGVGGAGGIAWYCDNSSVGRLQVVKAGVAGMAFYDTATLGPNINYMLVAAVDASVVTQSANNLGEEADSHTQTFGAGITCQTGTGPTFGLNIGQMRIYGVTHDVTQRERVRQYFRSKWGTP